MKRTKAYPVSVILAAWTDAPQFRMKGDENFEFA